MADMWRSAMAGYEIGSDVAGKIMGGFSRRAAGRAGIAASEAGEYAEKQGAVPVQGIPVEGQQSAPQPTEAAPTQPATKPTAMPESTTADLQSAEGQRVASTMQAAKATDISKLESGATAAEVAVKSEQYPATDREVAAYRVDPVATTRWDTAMEKLRKAAMKQTDPMKFLQDGEKRIRDMQQEGFLRNSNAAADLMAAGKYEEAALALTRAYAHVPDGRAMALQVVKGPDGKPRGISGYVYKEGGETFAPEATPWIESPQQITDLASKMKDPLAFSQMVEQRRHTDASILETDFRAKQLELELALKKQDVSRENRKWIADFNRMVTTDWAKMDLESRKFAVDVLSSVYGNISGGKGGKYEAGDLHNIKFDELQLIRNDSSAAADSMVSGSPEWATPGIASIYTEENKGVLADIIETSVLESRREGDAGKLVSPTFASGILNDVARFTAKDNGKGALALNVDILVDRNADGSINGYYLETQSGMMPIRYDSIPKLKQVMWARLNDPKDPINASPAARKAAEEWLARGYNPPNRDGVAVGGAGAGMSEKDRVRITGLAEGFNPPPKPTAPELPELTGEAPKYEGTALLSPDAQRLLRNKQAIPTE